MATTKEEAALLVYDKAHDALAAPMSELNQAGRELWCEQYLAAALAVTREYCPQATPALIRRAGLDVMLAPPRKRRARWRVDWGRVAGMALALASSALVISVVLFVWKAAS